MLKALNHLAGKLFYPLSIRYTHRLGGGKDNPRNLGAIYQPAI
jgi:hypothetical protein